MRSCRRGGGCPPSAASRRRSRRAGYGFGMSGTRAESSLNDRYARPGRNAFVRRSPRRGRAAPGGSGPRRATSPRRGRPGSRHAAPPRRPGRARRPGRSAARRARRACARSRDSARTPRSCTRRRTRRRPAGGTSGRPEHDDLAPGQPRRDDEPVERVRLGLASPDGGDRSPRPARRSRRDRAAARPLRARRSRGGNVSPSSSSRVGTSSTTVRPEVLEDR